jgi:hypothetical protein
MLSTVQNDLEHFAPINRPDALRISSRRIASRNPRFCDRPYCHMGGIHPVHVSGSCAECDSAREFLAYLGSDLTDSALGEFLSGLPIGWR